MRVAIVHEWLVTYAGSEKVVEQLLNIYPDADLFCVIDFLEEKDRHMLKGKKPITTFIQQLPFAKKMYKTYLPFMPLAVEQFDLSGYDVIISSSHAVAKGIITGPDQIHISYVHTPIRYAWDLQHQYLSELGKLKQLVSKLLLHQIRMWDVRTANGVDVFLANSSYIARRIHKIYRRQAQVVYPPVEVKAFGNHSNQDRKEYYFTASRLVPYKRIDLVVEAFAKMPDKELIVIGDGPEMKTLKQLATPNVKLLGYQPNAVLLKHMQQAKAFIFAGEEDFGISMVEAQAAGTPVIAYGKGGAQDIVKGLGENNPTGLFFEKQDADSVIDAVRQFELLSWMITDANCRQNAQQFSVEAFLYHISSIVSGSFNERFKPMKVQA